jgi:hypothetical protein
MVDDDSKRLNGAPPPGIGLAKAQAACSLSSAKTGLGRKRPAPAIAPAPQMRWRRLSRLRPIFLQAKSSSFIVVLLQRARSAHKRSPSDGPIPKILIHKSLERTPREEDGRTLCLSARTCQAESQRTERVSKVQETFSQAFAPEKLDSRKLAHNQMPRAFSGCSLDLGKRRRGRRPGPEIQ